MSNGVIIVALMVILPIAIVLIVSLVNYYNNKNKFKLLSDALGSSQISPEILDRLVAPPVKKNNVNGLLNAGVIVVGFGVGLSILLWVEAGFIHACVGCLFIFTGAGIIAAHYLGKKKS